MSERRDLERGHVYGLPSGEAVADAMGEAPLADDPLGLRAAGWSGETPLWLYFLAESASRGHGEQLGPSGGRIVAEVLIGILYADRGSYRANEPDWTPTLPAREERFGLTDLLMPAEGKLQGRVTAAGRTSAARLPRPRAAAGPRRPRTRP